MAIAHLILAHSAPVQLARLVKALRHPEARFYIHVDKKVDIRPFRKHVQGEDVTFVAARVNVRWGAYSMVQATLNGLEEVLRSFQRVTHINLLSGQDYPLAPAGAIQQFSERHSEKNFMRFLKVETEWQEALARLDRYHLIHYPVVGRNRLANLLNQLLPVRRMPFNMTAVGRSQWFMITGEAASYVVRYLREHPNVVRFFKLTWAPDELIFQTLLYNSPLRSTLVNDDLRYIDWSEGKASPRVLTLDDADALLRSGKLFARKFDAEVDGGILDLLDSHMATGFIR